MRCTVLGCSGGFPSIGRACSGYLVEAPGTRVWIDAGAGTLDALLRHCEVWELGAIWISHLHPDHWTDLPIALHQMVLDRPDEVVATPVTVFGPPGWVDDMGATVRWRVDDDDPVLVARELQDGGRYRVGALELEARRTDHSPETFGVRVRHGSQILGYSADSAPCDAVVDLGRQADVMINEAGTEDAHSPLHMNPEQAGQAATRAGCHRLVLTHLRPHADPDDVRRRAGAHFTGEIDVAQPGMRILLDRH